MGAYCAYFYDRWKAQEFVISPNYGSMSPRYFPTKIEEKDSQKNTFIVWFTAYLLYSIGNLKS